MFFRGRALPGLMSAASAGDNLVPSLQAVGSQDVALLAVLILHQGDKGGAVGVVLDAQHSGLYVVLLALEVDNAVLLAVAAATVADGDAAVAVAAGFFIQRSQQALLRTILERLV